MRVALTLLFASAVFVDSIACSGLRLGTWRNWRKVQDGVYVSENYVSDTSGIWYREYTNKPHGPFGPVGGHGTFGPPYTLEQATGTYEFLEVNRIFIAFGHGNHPATIMRDEHDRPFVISGDNHKVPVTEDELEEMYGLGRDAKIPSMFANRW